MTKASLPSHIASAVAMTVQYLAMANRYASFTLQHMQEDGLLRSQYHMHAPFRDAASRATAASNNIRLKFGNTGGQALSEIAQAPEGLNNILVAYLEGTDEMRELLEDVAAHPGRFKTVEICGA